jgi:RimJ/RimL family protein N-acetyltransferase
MLHGAKPVERLRSPGDDAEVPALEQPLLTERLLLRPFLPGDDAALYDLRTSPEVLRHLYWPPATPGEVRDIVTQRLTMTTLTADGDFLVLAVVRRRDGRLIGEADLGLVSLDNRHGELGVILHPDVQGQGYAAETATALLSFAFDVAGLHRVTAQTNAANEPAARAMLRLGLRQEGRLRQCVHFGGEWHDELLFAVLADEWAGRRC